MKGLKDKNKYTNLFWTEDVAGILSQSYCDTDLLVWGITTSFFDVCHTFMLF